MADPRHALLGECDAIDATIEKALRSAHLSAGLIPSDAHRSLFPWELDAHTNFAGIDDDVKAGAAHIAHQLAAQRAQFTRLLVGDLQATAAQAGPVSPDVAVAQRVIAIDALLGLQAVSGSQELFAGAEADLRQILHGVADAGGQRLYGEAAAQGVTVNRDQPLPLTAEQQARIELAARRLATGPQVDLVRALREAAWRMPELPGQLVPLLERSAAALSTGPLDTYARTTAQQAYGTGRMAAVNTLPDPVRCYSSELLDSNTCSNCADIDGHEYDSVEDSEDDYPSGAGYVDCEGGSLCRGVVVFVWPSETPPSVGQVPGMRSPDVAA